MQEVFGDSLLSAPLDKAETELPSPERLKRRIILKHKKLPPEGVKEETVAVSNALVDPTNTNDDVHGMDIAHSVLSGILYLQVLVHIIKRILIESIYPVISTYRMDLVVMDLDCVD